jgi:hypothetical protein
MAAMSVFLFHLVVLSPRLVIHSRRLYLLQMVHNVCLMPCLSFGNKALTRGYHANAILNWQRQRQKKR